MAYWLAAACVIPGALWSADLVEATRDAGKAAAREASSDADQWAGSQAAKAAPSRPAQPAAQVAPEAQVPAAQTPKAAEPSTLPAPTARSGRADLNEMTGKLLAMSTDPKVLRITVAGGFNVEFTYDAKTIMLNGGKPVSASDLSYGDELVVRYAGKELRAVEVDRVNKGPRLPVLQADPDLP
jgi:hypothetical protein